MADAPTFSDLQRIGRDEALSRNAALTVDAFDRDGADANVLNAGAAAMGDEIAAQLVSLIALSFLDSAEGADLDRLVLDRYGLVRKSAANAVGSVQFSTTANNPTAFTIPVNTVLQTGDGRQYVTTESALFDVGVKGPLLVGVRSVLAGASQQARIGTITSIVSNISGVPSDLVVTNTIATAGAANAESDASLRERGRRFFITARRGTIDAIEDAALAVPGVEKATAIEVIDTRGRPARSVLLVVTDAYTDTLAELNVQPATYQTQSRQLARAVFAGLSNTRAYGIYVQIQVAKLVFVSPRLNLRFKAGVNPDAVAQLACAAIVATTNALSPGAVWQRADMLSALRTVSGLDYTGDEIASPVGDVEPTILEVIRTTMPLVYASSSQSGAALATTSNPDAYAQTGD